MLGLRPLRLRLAARARIGTAKANVTVLPGHRLVRGSLEDMLAQYPLRTFDRAQDTCACSRHTDAHALRCMSPPTPADPRAARRAGRSLGAWCLPGHSGTGRQRNARPLARVLDLAHLA